MTPLMIAPRIILVAAGVALAACGGDAPANVAELQTSGPTTAAGPSSAPTEPLDDTLVPSAGSSDVIAMEPDDLAPGGAITGEAPQSIVDDLIERVSRETGVAPSEVIVVSAFAKTWTEGSLGCAEPGIGYTHREQAGYQVELVAAGKSWDFRVRENGDVIVCTDGLVR